MARADYDVTAEEFVRAWQASGGGHADPGGAEVLKMPKPIVLASASRYRQMGVNLKPACRGAKGLSVDELNAIIDELDRMRAQGDTAGQAEDKKARVGRRGRGS
jgi:hypothetical protein